MPLSHFLKGYFRQFPILGSRDRRVLSDACYCWYRASKGFTDLLPFEEKLQACLFLCDNQTPYTAKLLPAGLTEKPTEIEDRLKKLRDRGILFEEAKLLPFIPVLSNGITSAGWLLSMLRQPKLFIRLRKESQKIERLLHKANIPFEKIGTDCLALPNGSAIDKILPSDAYVVQDASSQAVGAYFPTDATTWWDCCCGAGGKSLLLKDKMPHAALTVTDIRPSIIHNLLERFRKYGLPQPSASVTDSADATALTAVLGKQRFDAIICDVPCSGSGTWARTPEGLHFFKEDAISTYAKKQYSIAANALQYLKAGGTMVYITCSVFEQENDGIVAQLMNSGHAVIQEQKLINGSARQADSMFMAVLKKL